MMTDDAFDMSTLHDDPDLVAVVAVPGALFGFLNRSVRVPPRWAGLVIGREGDRSIVQAGGEIEATDTADVVFVRTGPVPLAFQVDSVSSADEYLCNASLRLSVSLSEEAADVAARPLERFWLGIGPPPFNSSVHAINSTVFAWR